MNFLIFMYRLPYPLSPREMLWSQWEQINEKGAVIVTDDLVEDKKSKVDLSTGFVRGQALSRKLLGNFYYLTFFLSFRMDYGSSSKKTRNH